MQKIFIKLPEGARNIRLEKGYLWYDNDNFNGIIHEAYLSQKYKYKLLGVTPLSEEEWKEAVPNNYAGKDNPPPHFPIYYPEFTNKSEMYHLESATESGISLMESKGLDISKPHAVLIKEQL